MTPLEDDNQEADIVVPVYPTNAMIQAGMDLLLTREQFHVLEQAAVFVKVKEIWAAMIAARPAK